METSEIVKQILDFIEKSGSILLKSGFEISVRYVYAQAISRLVGFTISGIIFAYFLNKAKILFAKINKEDDWGYDYPSSSAFTFFLYAILVFISGLNLLFSDIPQVVRMFIAPEWFAIYNIINLVK